MHDVVIYLGTLPKINGKGFKQDIMCTFAEGVRTQGGSAHIEYERVLRPARVGLILGWVGFASGGAHIQFRQSIIDHQKQTGNRVMSIDGSCFKFAHKDTGWLRYSFDSVFYNEGVYANRNSNDAHWKMIQRDLGVSMQPWRASGDHILICLQRDGGWSGKGFDQDAWLKRTIKQIRSISQRTILIRPHPAAKNTYAEWQNKDKVYVSHSERSTLQQDLQNAHAAVFWNSSSAVAAALAGVPIFVSDNSCVAWDVANKDIGKIETPDLMDRTQWIHDLATAHWSLDQSRRGYIWNKFLPYL